MQLNNESGPAENTARPGGIDSVRGLLLSADAIGWQSVLQPLACRGIQVEVFDSAVRALAAVSAAAGGPSPYRVIMLGRHVQGMDASVLAAAIKANPAYKETPFVLLEDTNGTDSTRLAHEDFTACLIKDAERSSIESTLVRLFYTSKEASAPARPVSLNMPLQNDNALPFSGFRILVADDNPVNQQVAARMLEKLGCLCGLAADGEQAIEMHASSPFDLILMDCEMPVLDGLQATRRIREAEASHRTPIIALTACTGPDEQEQCNAAGMDDFLSKPIRPQTLRDLLARWLPQGTTAANGAPAATCSDELEAVREMFGTDFGELAVLYQNDGPPRLAAIREAYAISDCARVAKVTHALAGSSASIGATGLSALCKEVETAAKAGSLDEFERRMMAIETEYSRICSKLQSLLKP